MCFVPPKSLAAHTHLLSRLACCGHLAPPSTCPPHAPPSDGIHIDPLCWQTHGLPLLTYTWTPSPTCTRWSASTRLCSVRSTAEPAMMAPMHSTMIDCRDSTCSTLSKPYLTHTTPRNGNEGGSARRGVGSRCTKAQPQHDHSGASTETTVQDLT